MTILHIDSSILGDHSASRELTAAIVQRIAAANPSSEITRYDLAAEPLGDLTGGEFMAFQGAEPQDERTKRSVAHNAKVLDDFLAADVIVVGAPMYNFSLPSQLKAWFDRLAVGGKTFRYGEHGPEGLVKGKKVIIASSRGGSYSGDSPAAFLDHQETYLKVFFGFIGVTDVTFIRAEGVSAGPEARKVALETAISKIKELAA